MAPSAPSDTGSEEAGIEGLRERKRAHSRATTIDVALSLFADRGYDAVTVADICAAAGIAPRTFFRYFAAKEDLLTEPVREMNEQLAGFLAAEPLELPDTQVLRRALGRLGGHVLENRDRLARVLGVVASVTAVRSSPVLMLSVQERQLAERLTARRGGSGPADWRTRLLVARALAAFRIWLDDVITGGHPDPAGHLDEVLATI